MADREAINSIGMPDPAQVDDADLPEAIRKERAGFAKRQAEALAERRRILAANNVPDDTPGEGAVPKKKDADVPDAAKG